jgi:hypothetical protein
MAPPLDSYEGVLLLELRVLEKALAYTTNEVRTFNLASIRHLEMLILSITGNRIYPEVAGPMRQVDVV